MTGDLESIVNLEVKVLCICTRTASHQDMLHSKGTENVTNGFHHGTLMRLIRLQLSHVRSLRGLHILRADRGTKVSILGKLV